MTFTKKFTGDLFELFDANCVSHLIDLLSETLSDRKSRCVKTAINYLKYVITHADEYEDAYLNMLFYQTYSYVCVVVDIVPLPPQE